MPEQPAGVTAQRVDQGGAIGIVLGDRLLSRVLLSCPR
jgi:hypothetical protein